MNKVCCIYKITSPSGRIYIGQSIDFHKRIVKYKNHKCIQQHKLYASFNKYGFINHKFEIIEECDKSMLNTLEIHYINLYNTFNTKHGLNIRQGGVRGELSPESIEKIKKSCKEYVLKHGNHCSGKKASVESRLKMSQSRRRYIEKNGNYIRGNVTQEAKQNMSDSAMKIPINQIDLISGKIIRVWKSFKEVSENFGIKNCSALRRRCRREYNEPYMGFNWEYNKNNME